MHARLAVMIAPLIAFAAAAAAGETRQIKLSEPEAIGAAALWENFTSALRSGSFAEAHACFSPASRRVFSFEAFAAHYHPLTAAYEATLSPVEEGQFRLCGDYAVLRFVAASAAPSALAEDDRRPNGLAGSSSTRRGVMVTALMVREDGRWWLVAAARERSEKLEALARNLLRSLAAAPAVRRAWESGRPLDAVALAAAAPQVMHGSEASLCRQHYRFSLANGGSGLRLQACALAPELRSFVLEAVDESPRVRSAVADEAETGTRRKASSTVLPKATPEQGKIEKKEEADDGLPPPAPDLGDPAEASAVREEP